MNYSMSSNEAETVAGPGLTHLFTMRAALGARLDGGDGPLGRRVFNAASGGEFAGARLRGAVVPGSADWMLIRRDGSMVIDARAILQTDDGATIHMRARHLPGGRTGRRARPGAAASDRPGPLLFQDYSVVRNRRGSLCLVERRRLRGHRTANRAGPQLRGVPGRVTPW